MTNATNSDDIKIHVPENLVTLLKEFTKSVIREQPQDLLTWTEQYFRQKAQLREEEHKLIENSEKLNENSTERMRILFTKEWNSEQ